MTTVYIAPGPFGAGGQFFGLGGLPLNLGTITTYAAGTTTPLVTYTTSAGSVQNANPIILGTDGRPPNEIWLTAAAYRFDLKDSLGNLIKTYDNLGGFVDAASLASTSSSLGAYLVGWIRSAVGAVATTVGTWMGWQPPHIKEFGAVCDGVTDDTSAINACITANPNRTINISGTPLISSTITLTGKVRLVFEGGTASGAGFLPSSYLKKSTSMTTVGLLVGTLCVVENGGVYCQAGSTGGGIQLAGNSPTMRGTVAVAVSSASATGIGIRVGDDLGTNTNSWMLDRCSAAGMGSHGFYIHDGSGGGPSANAGKMILPQALSNGGDGIRVGTAWLNSIDSPLVEINTGYGIRLMPASINNRVAFGDQDEANVTGNILNEGTGNIFFGISDVGFTDSGTETVVISRLGSKVKDLAFGTGTSRLGTYTSGTSWTPAVAGTSTAGTQTYTDRAGRYTQIGDIIIAPFRVNMSAKDAATAGSIQITGLPVNSNAAVLQPGIAIGSFQNINLTGFTQLSGYVVAGSNVIQLVKNALNGSESNVAAADISATTLLTGVVMYHT